MFDVYCATCASRRLIAPGRVKGLINDDQGIVVVYECWCGDLGVLRTGSAAEARETVAA